MTLRDPRLSAPARWGAYAGSLLALGALAVYLTPGIYGAPIRFTVAGIVVTAAGGVLAANAWLKPRIGVATTALAIVAAWAVLGPMLPLLTGACGDPGACSAPKIASWVVSGALWGALSVIVTALLLAVRAGARLSLTILRSARSFVTRTPKPTPATTSPATSASTATRTTKKTTQKTTTKSTKDPVKVTSTARSKSVNGKEKSA